MRTVDYTQIVESVRQMCLEANTVLLPMWKRPWLLQREQKHRL